jgi:F-type H+-transporting ATPase subunit epsilon
MARTKFTVEVLTPEGEVFNEEVEMVSTKTAIGSIGLLAHHQPMLATLDPAELRLYRSDSDIVRYVQGEGYLQVQAGGERVLVLVDEVFEPGQVNASEVKEKLDRARGELESAEKGSAEESTAKRAVHRYESFVKVAEGESSSS